MKCTIIIDGESANELFAVGVNDLLYAFLKKRLHVNHKDVVKIHFEEIRQNGKIINAIDAVLSGEKYKVITSKENFDRDKN